MNTLLFTMPFLTIANVISAFRVSNASGKIIVIILFLGSIFAWSIMATKFIQLKSAVEQSKRFLSAYKNEKHPMRLFFQRQKYPESPLYKLYQAVCNNVVRLLNVSEARTADLFLNDMGKTKHPLKEHQLRSVRNLADQTLSEEALELEKHMGILATAATAAPFLGLLGTVWGVMDAFGGLALTASATMAAVAPGVSGALLTTVVGLLVALPSVIGYNILTGRIRKLSIMMERFTQELMADIENRLSRE